MTPSRLVLASSVLLYALFFFWYGGETTPITPAEADEILAEIRSVSQARSGGHHDPDLIESFRVLTRDDDGREFYMLNLMRFRETALYPEGYDYDDDPIAAADRYNAAVVPALLRHGSLPILMGRYAGAFIPHHPTDEWDQIGIIRYRSRRDMLEMAREINELDQGIHKWASIEKTIVFPVAPIFDLVFVRGVVFVVVMGIGGISAAALRRRDARR